MKLKYIFGPVLSRRLGKSLGIDLIPYKTCSLDCIYCECGKTDNLTTKREEYVPTEDVIAELDGYLKNQPDLDYITFAGSGEPTLHNNISKIIEFIKRKYPSYKIALITNGVLFQDNAVIEGIKKVDLIIPSLDAVSQSVFEKINRPASNIKSSDIIKGLKNLRKEYNGELWLEIFIVPGINDTADELQLFRDTIEVISPDKIQINSLDRPGTEDWVNKSKKSELSKISDFLKNNKLKIEIL